METAIQILFNVGALMVLIYGLFRFAETYMKETVRHKISDALMDFATSSESYTEKSTYIVHTLFNDIFGRRHLTLRCFLVSGAASQFSLCTILIIVFGNTFIDFLHAVQRDGTSYDFLFFLVSGSVMNLAPDYLSLGITRLLIDHLHKNRRDITTRRLFGYLFLDTVVAGLIGFITIVLVLYLMERAEGFRFGAASLDFYIIVSVTLLSFTGDDFSAVNLVGIFFYSAFFPSIWLWIYYVAISFARLVEFGRRGMLRIWPLFDFEGHVLSMIGVALGIFVGGLWLLGLFVLEFLYR